MSISKAVMVQGFLLWPAWKYLKSAAALVTRWEFFCSVMLANYSVDLLFCYNKHQKQDDLRYLCIISTDEASFLTQSTTCFTFLVSDGHCLRSIAVSVLPSAQLNDLSEHWVLLVIPPWAQGEAPSFQNQINLHMAPCYGSCTKMLLTRAPGLNHSITHCMWSSALKLKTLSLSISFSIFFFFFSSPPCCITKCLHILR